MPAREEKRDPLEEFFSIDKENDGKRDEHNRLVWVVHCHECGREWDLIVNENLQAKLGDRNALQAHVDGHHGKSAATLRRRT